MADEAYDLVVIGAGIQGAGVAREAAARGWRVLVLEQTGIAAGTSCRSSKLIHGGLRYLESGQFRLVRECLQERTRLLQAYPDLVRLTPHFIPVYRHTRRRPWQIRLGLSLYALLGGLSPAVRFRRLAPEAWPGLDGLQTRDLQVVYQYFDGQTDDAALTRRVMAQAQAGGAEPMIPGRLLGARYQGNGFEIEFDAGGTLRQVRARRLVNAAGPWVNAVAACIEGGHAPAPAQTVAGTHLVFDRPLGRGVYYVESPLDGRAVFVMPWQRDKTLVGTTEREWSGEPGAIEHTREEVAYLRQTLWAYFPGYRDCRLIEAFAGLRVLPACAGAAFGRSRETRLVSGAEGHLISIYGGKLTAFRATAARVIARLPRA